MKALANFNADGSTLNQFQAIGIVSWHFDAACLGKDIFADGINGKVLDCDLIRKLQDQAEAEYHNDFILFSGHYEFDLAWYKRLPSMTRDWFIEYDPMQLIDLLRTDAMSVLN